MEHIEPYSFAAVCFSVCLIGELWIEENVIHLTGRLEMATT